MEIDVIFSVQGCNEFIEIIIEARNIEKIVAHLGTEMPVIFLYNTPACAARIRSQLKMTSKRGPYYDPGSQGKYYLIYNY